MTDETAADVSGADFVSVNLHVTHVTEREAPAAPVFLKVTRKS